MRRPLTLLCRRSSPLIACALVAACAGGAARPAPVAPLSVASASASEAPRATWVVLSPTALLLERPDPTAIGARAEIEAAKAEALRDDDAQYALFQRGEERGEFVELASLAAAPKGYGCSAPLGALADFAITLWTRKSGLATVTTRKVRTVYADGTAVSLAPGVVLHPHGSGFQARVDPPFVLDVDVPADARGDAFAVTRGFDVDAKTVGSFDGAFRFSGREWSADVLGEHRGVYATSPDAKGSIATLRTQCAQYEVRPGGAIDTEEYGWGGLGMLGTGAGGNCQYAPKGAPVHFRSGELAGYTRKALALPPTAEKNRACWVRSLAGDGSEREAFGVRSWLELCVRMTDTKYGACPS